MDFYKNFFGSWDESVEIGTTGPGAQGFTLSVQYTSILSFFLSFLFVYISIFMNHSVLISILIEGVFLIQTQHTYRSIYNHYWYTFYLIDSNHGTCMCIYFLGYTASTLATLAELLYIIRINHIQYDLLSPSSTFFIIVYIDNNLRCVYFFYNMINQTCFLFIFFYFTFKNFWKNVEINSI